MSVIYSGSKSDFNTQANQRKRNTIYCELNTHWTLGRTRKHWWEHGHIDGNTALIVHCGTNDLAVENEEAAATKLRMLINDLKPKTKSLAISAVTLRNDSAAVTARKVNRFNRLTETICEQTNVCFSDNRNTLVHHLNRSNLHLNSSGSKVLGSNLCRYLRRANLPPSGQELTTKLATGFLQDHFRVRKPSSHTTMWTNYLSQVREMTNHWTRLMILIRIVH